MSKRGKKSINVPRDEFEERVGRLEDRDEFMEEFVKRIADAVDENAKIQKNILNILKRQELEDKSRKKRG